MHLFKLWGLGLVIIGWLGLELQADVQAALQAQSPVQPRQSEWVQLQVERCLDAQTTPQMLEAQVQAQARQQAIERVAGVWVESQLWVEQGVFQAESLHQFSRARIVKENTLQALWHSPASNPLPCFSLQRAFLVEPHTEVPPEAPVVSLYLNQQQFRAGESATVSFRVNQDSFLTLYNISEDGSVTRLLPNARQPEPFQALQNQNYVFPDADLQAAGLVLKARVLPGRQQSQESLLLIATRQPLPSLDLGIQEGLFQVSDRFSTALYPVLQRRLLSLPAGDWGEARAHYSVSR